MSIRVILNITDNNPEKFDFDMEGTAQAVCETVLVMEHCPIDTEVSLTYVDDDEIHDMNRSFRGIDRVTDVLSFPNIDFCVYDEAENSAEGGSSRDVYQFQNEEGLLIRPSSWNRILHDPEKKVECLDPDTGCLFLGDIILNLDRVKEQAKEYGHSVRREFAFLIAHSMLHLCGYDHMTQEQSAVMFGRQEKALERLGITRDIPDQPVSGSAV